MGEDSVVDRPSARLPEAPTNRMNIKILRQRWFGPKVGHVYQARLIRRGYYNEYQILSDGLYLGKTVDCYDAIELTASEVATHAANELMNKHVMA